VAEHECPRCGAVHEGQPFEERLYVNREKTKLVGRSDPGAFEISPQLARSLGLLKKEK
jgi:hypothetical protein